jgi:two-component system chemotaxis sensor kinase CheA
MENSLSFEIEADEVELFLQDVNEHLQVMEAGILQLEQGASKGKAADPEILNAVFRAAHTLKATAATVGHYEMSELTHTIETLFDRIREGEFSLDPAAADELLSVVDVLKALRDEVVSLEPSGVDVATIVFRLHSLVEGAAGEGTRPFVAEEIVGEIGRPLTPEQAAQAQDYEGQGYALMEVNAATGVNVFAPAARLLQAALAMAEVGQIITQRPSQTDLVNDRHEGRLWLVLATQAGSDAVEEQLRDVTDLAGFQVLPYTISAMPQPSPEAPALRGRREDKTVRISVERLDTLMNLVGELVTDRTRLVQVEETLRAQYGKEGAIDTLDDMTSHFARVVDQLQTEVMQARMLPIAQLFNKCPRLVRDVSRTAEKQVRLVIEGESTELDRSIIEAIGDPLTHLLRNAVDHGIESPRARAAAGKPPDGTVRLTAAHEEGHVVVTVRDDGRGIDPARIRQAAVRRGLLSEDEAAQLDDDKALALIFQPKLSTSEQVTGTSGRGVGLDVVYTNVKRLNGSVTVESEVGRGAAFRVTLPLTLAIIQAMLVALGDDVYAIPLASIVESLYLSDVKLSSVKGNPIIRWRDQALPLLPLRRFFAHPRLTAPVNDDKQAIVTVAWGKLRAGLIVDELIGKQEIVVKSLNPILGDVPGLSGCTILGDGRIALIVDIPSLMSVVMQTQQGVSA